MNCQELKDLVPEYLAAALSPEALQGFEAHLMECENCRLELRGMETTWTALGDLPDEDPAPEARGRFYAMLEAEKRNLAREQRVPWFRRVEYWLETWWPRRPAVQMAMIAVVAVVGLLAGSGLEGGVTDSGEISELRGEVQQMYQMMSMSLLDQKSSTDRLRGVNWSSRVEDPSSDLLYSLSSTLNSDPNENVRLAAVDALSSFRDRPGVLDALMQSLAEEDSPAVQIALIDLLIAIQEKTALEALKQFIEQRDVIPPVKQHAETQIKDFL